MHVIPFTTSQAIITTYNYTQKEHLCLMIIMRELELVN